MIRVADTRSTLILEFIKMSYMVIQHLRSICGEATRDADRVWKLYPRLLLACGYVQQGRREKRQIKRKCVSRGERMSEGGFVKTFN